MSLDRESTPFNFESEKHKKEFEAKLKNKEYVKTVVDWYVSNNKKMISEGISASDLEHSIIAEDNLFLRGHFTEEIKKRISNDSLRTHILSQLDNDPTLCFRTPSLTQQSNETDITRLSEKIEFVKELLKLPHNIDYDDLTFIATSFWECSLALADAVYFYFLLEQAQDTIKATAPSLEPVLQKITSNLILVESKKEQTDLDNDFAAGMIGSMYDLTLQKSSSSVLIDSSHAQQVLITGHEVLHIVLNELLETPHIQPGWRKRLENGILTTEEEELLSTQKAGTLHGVLLEGLSIAFEFEFIKYSNLETSDSKDLEKLNTSGKIRLEYIRKINFLGSPKLREKHSFSQKFLERITNARSYSEGAVLAIALRRNGWEMNDLPLLVEEIKKIIEEEAGQNTAQAILKIKIDDTVSSVYKRIIRKIRQLKKNTSS